MGAVAFGWVRPRVDTSLAEPKFRYSSSWGIELETRLVLHLDDVLQHGIHGGHHLGVRFKSSLGDDEIGKAA
jgi:hypothetical protein